MIEYRTNSPQPQATIIATAKVSTKSTAIKATPTPASSQPPAIEPPDATPQPEPIVVLDAAPSAVVIDAELAATPVAEPKAVPELLELTGEPKPTKRKTGSNSKAAPRKQKAADIKASDSAGSEVAAGGEGLLLDLGV